MLMRNSPPPHTLIMAMRAAALLRPASRRGFCATAESRVAAFTEIGVVGAGQMGVGIAIVAAANAELRVSLYDRDKGQLAKALGFANSFLQKSVAKGKLTEEQGALAMDRFAVTSELGDLAEVDFVVEAATENPELKATIFGELCSTVKEGAILASNTSSIPITRIGAATQRPESVIGMHFMNPVPVMKLVEVIPSLASSDETVATTLALARAMGKTTAMSKDVPGFIANRLLMPYINEAVIALETGVGTADDIDTVMKLGTNVPMGPLTLADFIGLDTCLAIMETLHSGLGDSKYRAAPLLRRYVDAGWLGKKSGRGFYDY